MFQSERKVVLRGATKQESSSDQVLQQAKEERARRKLAKLEPISAIKIQTVFRGYYIRKQLQLRFQLEWIEKYVSSQDLSACKIENTAWPLALHALLPTLFSRRRTQLCTGSTLSTSELTQPAIQCLRGLFLLLLKYLSNQSLSRPQTSLISVDDDDGHAPSWNIENGHRKSLLQRTTLLCCACIGAEDHQRIDPLIQTAAARILFLISSVEVSTKTTHREEGEKITLLISHAARRILDCTSTDYKEKLMPAFNHLMNAGITRISTGNKPGNDVAMTQSPMQPIVEHVLTRPGFLHALNKGSDVWKRLTDENQLLMPVLRCCCALRFHKICHEDRLCLLTNITGLFIAAGSNSAKHDSMTPATIPTRSELCKNAYSRAILHCINGSGSTSRTHQNCQNLTPHDKNSAGALDASTLFFGDGLIASKLYANSLVSLDLFCAIYNVLLEGESLSGDPTTTTTTTQNASSLKLLSALAFGMGDDRNAFLPRLWKHLATCVGLPLEISDKTTRFHISSLPRGIWSVPPQHQRPFALFCRVFTHYLSAIDDTDFFSLPKEHKGLFHVGVSRAIAASLTVLVIKTHLPDTTSPTPSPSSHIHTYDENSTNTANLLLAYASRALRALFDRDCRQSFCPPALWLGPYKSSINQRDQQQISGETVLRALLQRNEREESISSHHTRKNTMNTDIGLASVLMQAPQCIPFQQRVELFRGLVALDKQSRRFTLPPIEGGPKPIRIVIRRDRILEDAVTSLLPLGGALRGPLSITFIDSRGMEEAGIDMGGLTKELLESIAAVLLQPERGLFTQTSSATRDLYPNPSSSLLQEAPQLFTLAGLILGKALYEGILIPMSLASFFIARLQGRLPTLDDLAALDPEVHRSVVSLKNYTINGNVGDLGLDFTVESNVFGSTVIEELIPGGRSVQVNDSNKLLYCHLLADWHLRRRLGAAASQFSSGMSKILRPEWLRFFSPHEVNLLLGGGDGGDIDIEDLRKYTQYSGGYSSSSRTVQLFWSVMKSFTAAERCELLRFATSSSRAPLGGFRHLSPPFTIHKVVERSGFAPLTFFGAGRNIDRLPTASTCANTLKLPDYTKESNLKERILYAIRSKSGFNLS